LLVLSLISNGQELLDEYSSTRKKESETELKEDFMRIFDNVISALYQDFCNHISLNSLIVNKIIKLILK